MAKVKKNKSWWDNDSPSSSKYKYSDDSSYQSSYFNWDSWKSTYKPENKKQIVKPYLSWYEGDKLTRGVYGDKIALNEIAQKFGQRAANDPTKNQKFLNEFQNKGGEEAIKSIYKGIVPDHLIEDIYSIYFNESKNLEFTELKNSNITKFKILEKVNNSLLKIVSNNNSIASFLYTKNIARFLLEEFLDSLSEEEQEDLKNSMKNSNQEDDEKESNESSNNSGKGNKNSSKGDRSSEKTKNNSSKPEDKDKEKSGDSKQNGENSDEKSDDSSSGDNEGSNESSDSQGQDNESNEDNSGDGSQEGKSSKGASKSGTSSNPLKGHGLQEDTSRVQDWKKENQKSQKELTREEALAQKIESIFSKPEFQQRFDEAIMKADQMMSDLEKAGINLTKDGLSQIAELNNMQALREDISKLGMNKRAIAEAIKQILNNSKNYFSKKYKLKEIEFLEADEIEDIYGLEYLHPIFKNTMLNMISTDEKIYQGKIDLFIDVSGSMGSNSGIPGVSNLLFAKSIALAMYNMDLLNNLYTFDTRITKIPISELNILMIGFGGGTCIETVVQYVVNTSKNNAICLTDGEDSVSTYDERMFFMGTIGVMFSYFSGNRYSGSTKDKNGMTAGQKYIYSRQCINFDGNKSTLITPQLLKEKKMWYGE